MVDISAILYLWVSIQIRSEKKMDKKICSIVDFNALLRAGVISPEWFWCLSDDKKRPVVEQYFQCCRQDCGDDICGLLTRRKVLAVAQQIGIVPGQC